VGDALAALWALHPGVRDRVVTEQGEVRPHVNVFVGVESIRFTGGLETPLRDGAEISIVPAVSGGRDRWAAAPQPDLRPARGLRRASTAPESARTPRRRPRAPRRVRRWRA